MTASKYLEVDCEGGLRLSCRICSTEIYVTPPQAGLDPDRMNAALEHFQLQHGIGREEIARDAQDAFDGGMRWQVQKR